MASLPSASFNDMRTVAEAEIRQEIDGHLAELNGSIAEWRKPHHALQAQLLMQELTRREFELAQREQRRQTKTMVVCTVIITILTVFIAILAAIMAWR